MCLLVNTHPRLLTWWSDWVSFFSPLIIAHASKARIGHSEDKFKYFQSCPCWQTRWFHCTEPGPTGDTGVWGTYGQTVCWWAAYMSLSSWPQRVVPTRGFGRTADMCDIWAGSTSFAFRFSVKYSYKIAFYLLRWLFLLNIVNKQRNVKLYGNYG